MARNPWTTTIVGELKSTARNALVGGPFGSNLVSADYVPHGVPVIRGENMGHGRWVDGAFAFVSEAKAVDLSPNQARPGDLVFTQRGTIGQVALIPKGRFDRYVISQSQMKLTPDDQKADGLFLYYAFSSPQQQDYIRRNAIQTGVPHTNLGILRDTPLCLPPLEEQKAIAEVLGALDDKIELNRRTNETLEAIARAIFKSWFVDFDPVRAKVEGRQPTGITADIAAMFPGRFVDSPLGLIPEGWQLGSVLSQARLLSGGTPKTHCADYWGGDVRWASAKDVSQASDAILVETERSITTKGLNESATQLIPAWCTVVVARGATTGRMVLFGRDMAMNQTCYALQSLTDTPLALHCQLREEVSSLVHAAHGSVFDTITTTTFATSQVVVAPTPLLHCFEDAVAPLFQRMLANIKESSTLKGIRDALLPKLLSGEVRVSGTVIEVGAD